MKNANFHYQPADVTPLPPVGDSEHRRLARLEFRHMLALEADVERMNARQGPMVPCSREQERQDDASKPTLGRETG